MFIDVHAHVSKYPYPSGNGIDLFMTADELREVNRRENIELSILLPIVSSETYVPQSVGEVIDIANESGGEFIPFMNIDPRVLSNTSDSPIGSLIEFYLKQGCRGIGEVLPLMAWKEPRMQNLLKHAESFRLPLIFDMSAQIDQSYGIYDDPGMPQLEACLNKFPNLTFVGHGPAFWAEITTVEKHEDRLGYPKGPVHKEGRVAQLMRTYPNLWVDLSAGSGANALTRDEEYAVKFLNEFSYKIMFGTDYCYAGQPVLPTAGLLIRLRSEGRLSPEAFEMIARGNAKRLLKL